MLQRISIRELQSHCDLDEIIALVPAPSIRYLERSKKIIKFKVRYQNFIDADQRAHFPISNIRISILIGLDNKI